MPTEQALKARIHIQSLGAAPQGYENRKDISAESAIQLPAHQLDQAPIESRFQR